MWKIEGSLQEENQQSYMVLPQSQQISRLIGIIKMTTILKSDVGRTVGHGTRWH